MTSVWVCHLWPFVSIFCSTYVVQLSNRKPYFYRFWCHNPLITQLSFADCKWKKYLLRLSHLYVRDFSFETWSIIKVWRFDCHHFLVCPPVKWKQVWHFFLLSRDYSVQCLFDLRLFSVEIKKETDGNCNMHASVCFLVSSCYYMYYKYAILYRNIYFTHFDLTCKFIGKMAYSLENTRKTWNTNFIIVCQNLIGLYS